MLIVKDRSKNSPPASVVRTRIERVVVASKLNIAADCN